jgi:HAD superfamily hydrolase (TIGR01509 family)
MNNLDVTNRRTARAGPLTACIFDVDGVLLASPHEQAWREALSGFADPERFTTAMYQAQVAGKPRLEGARAALEALDVPNAGQLTARYAQLKQERLEELMKSGKVVAFPDALRFVEALTVLDFPCAAASSSKNADEMMRSIHLSSGGNLLDSFKVNVCGRDLAHGKPSPDIFLLAARELEFASINCLVVEDAPAGIEAARAGGMTALGIARLSDTATLLAAGADLVVTSLDQISIDNLSSGRLSRRAT